MAKRQMRQWVWLLLIIGAVVLVVRAGLLVIGMSEHGSPTHHVMATRMMGLAYMLCDIVISSSLVLLLLTRDRRAPAWAERRLPARGRWMWHFLLCLTILSYISLAPTFLFFLIQMRK
jgi:hypothetical protein